MQAVQIVSLPRPPQSKASADDASLTTTAKPPTKLPMDARSESVMCIFPRSTRLLQPRRRNWLNRLPTVDRGQRPSGGARHAGPGNSGNTTETSRADRRGGSNPSRATPTAVDWPRRRNSSASHPPRAATASRRETTRGTRRCVRVARVGRMRAVVYLVRHIAATAPIPCPL